MSIRKASLSSKKIAEYITGLASAKKAEDIVILDMRKVANFCDYFVLCSGNTDRQVRAIADGIDEGLAELGSPVHFKEGLKQCDWVVFDSGDVVVHIFQKKIREFYNLEYLWREAKRVNFER